MIFYHMISFRNNRVFAEVIMYARELETQLRSLKMHNEVGFGTLCESNIAKNMLSLVF